MLQKTDLQFFENLLIKNQQESQIPRSVLKSDEFKNLLDSEIVIWEKSGRGKIYKISDETAFVKFINNRFPDVHFSEASKVNNVAKYRNSKAEKTKNTNVIFLRADSEIEINNKIVDLEYYTSNFGFFACNLESLKTQNLCFVENLDTFLIVENLLKFDFVFFHTYGRVGKDLVKKISAEKILVFSDYDFIGLNEYLNFCEIHNDVTFFMPDNYDELFTTFSKSFSKNARQRPSEKVLNSQDEVVVKIREQLFKTSHFLEQQSLFIDLK